MDKIYIGLIVVGILIMLAGKFPQIWTFFTDKAGSVDVPGLDDLKDLLDRTRDSEGDEFMKNVEMIKKLHDNIENPQIKNYLRVTVLPELLRDDVQNED